jgi:Ca2+-transporting ATPase
MVTGDHPETAYRIASLVGIAKEGSSVLTGGQIEELSDKELLAEISRVSVFARVAPQQKLRLARLLKGAGEVVAMTGDGINDAPALRNADIGIALGSGTDVAKEASDLILLNNGFDIIVSAIEEGRRIIDNLKKITAYLLSTGFSEITLVGGALIASAPLPLLPAQILWVNIVSEGFMNFAFAFEPKESDIMKRDPRIVKSTIVTPQIRTLIVIIGLVSGALLIALYFALSQLSLSLEEIRTIMFVALSAVSIFFSFSLKNINKPIWKINLFSNKYLLAALGMSFLFLFGALLIPPLAALLSLQAISLPFVLLIIAFGLVNLILIEAVKYFVFRKKNLSMIE